MAASRALTIIPLRLLAQIIHRDRALGRFRKLRNSLSVASSQRDVLPKDAAKKKRNGQKGEKRARKETGEGHTGLLHDKGGAEATFC